MRKLEYDRIVNVYTYDKNNDHMYNKIMHYCPVRIQVHECDLSKMTPNCVCHDNSLITINNVSR